MMGTTVNLLRKQTILLLALLAMAGLGWMGSRRAQAEAAVWDALAFKADPLALHKAVSAITTEEGTFAVVALEETRMEFQADGRHTYTHRLIYRPLSQAGAEGWASVSATWEPWHQKKPRFRARVIAPSGKETWLDPKTLTESGSGEQEDRVFSDDRKLTGPLPAMAPGVVVEEEYQIEETAPFFTHGVVQRIRFGQGVPSQQTRLLVQAPASLPLRWIVQGLKMEPQRITSGDTVTLLFESGRMEAREDTEPLAPPVPPHRPQVILSAGRSWQEVASVYYQQVEAQLAGADVSSLLSAGVTKNAARADTVESLIRVLHKEIRYTGVEYGEASIIPVKPAETLQRKYGDCKDKAALLVAMLRAAGHPAYLALLKTSEAEETEPDLPGLGSFDHAIVYVPGTPEYWVDATDEHSRLGQLPAMDADRLALIVRPETTGLQRTPQATARDNHTVETREFTLSERGPAQVVETTAAVGSGEASYRSYYRDNEAKDIRKQLEAYAKNTYLGVLTRYENPDPQDFSKPFTLRLEMEKSQRGFTDEAGSAVGINLGDLLSRMPDLEPEKDEDETAKKKEAPQGRHSDLLLPEPFVTEWQYRIVPPPGFRARPLPENKTEKMGPATYSQEFAVDASGVVTAHLSFDTGQRRFTPAQAEALRAGVKELRNREAILVTFEHTAQALLEAGKMRAALVELRRLIGLHPKEALHQEQLARAFLQAGLGESARVAARKAVEIEPTAEAYNTLAWILQHDLIGRRFEAGYDRAGAIAAYRKARELNPEDAAPLGNMAIVMERDLFGMTYTQGSLLAEAIQAYQSAGDKLDDIGLLKNLPIALFYAGRFKEMEDAAKKMDAKKFAAFRNEFFILAKTATAGADQAIQFAAREISDDEARRAALSGAGGDLLRIRLYKESAQLLRAGARGTPQASDVGARATVIENIVRSDQGTLDEKDPRTVVRKLLVLATNTQATYDETIKLVSRQARELDEVQERKDLAKIQATLRISAKNANLPVHVLADIGTSTLSVSMTSEGNDQAGYKIRTQGPTASTQSFYVVREDGKYLVVDTSQNPSEIGGEILARIQRGELPGARQMLDWIREDMKAGGGDDPLDGPVFPRFWNRGDDPDPEKMRLAAAALLWAKRPAEALAVLQAALPRAGETDRLRLQLALASTYQKIKKWGELAEAGQTLLQAHPNSETALGFALTGLMNQRRFADVERILQQRLQRLPNDPEAIRQLAELASNQGQMEKAVQLLRGLADSNRGTSQDLNGLAWAALIAGQVSASELQIAQRANLQTKQADFGILHTVAALQIELGQAAEARAVILKAISAASLEEPNSECWYIFGRLAEDFGEVDAAESAYKKVEKPEGEIWPGSTYSLTQRRLAGLKSKANL